MKRLKKKILYGVSFLVICLISVSSVIYINNKNNPNFNSEFVIDMSEKNYRKVYLLDESNTLVPLSIEVNKKEHLVDEIYTVVSTLRDLEVKGFNGVLAKDIKINKIELENGILNIDFSSEFLNYDKENEEKIIESLTWSVLDFNEVKGLTISVDGVALRKMPLNGLVLPNVLDKSIGINKYNDMMNKCVNCEDVVVLYSKTIDEVSYYVPVTRRVENNSESLLIDGLKKDVSVLSNLNKIDELERLSELRVDKEEVSVVLDDSYLVEDNLVDPLVYELLMVTFFYNDIDYKVNFIVNEEYVEVNGYNVDDMMVSSIKFNEIKI